MPALPATSASQLDRWATTGAPSRAARVRIGRDHLRERVELSPGPLRVLHEVLVENDAEVTGGVRISSSAPLPSQSRLTSATPSESNSLKKAHTSARIFDPREGIGDVAEQILAQAQVAALIAQRNAHLRQSVLGLARALQRLGRAPGEALQRHIERLLLDTGSLRGKAQFLQASTPTPILSAVLPITSAAEMDRLTRAEQGRRPS
jgi:hypothetical protein